MKTILYDVNLELIFMSPELKEVQDFMPIDDTDLERLKKDIESNGIRDPLKVYRNPQGKGFLLLAGYNRLEIAKELKLETVPVEILNDLAPKKRKELCIDDNLNRRHFTREQKKNLIGYFLKQYPNYSNRAIADITKADHKTVGEKRTALESSGEIPQLKTTTGRDGKVRKTKQARPTKHNDVISNDTTPPASKTARTKTDKNGHREPASNQNEAMQIGRALACIDFALNLCNGKATKETLESVQTQLEKARKYLT